MTSVWQLGAEEEAGHQGSTDPKTDVTYVFNVSDLMVTSCLLWAGYRLMSEKLYLLQESGG